MQAATTYLKFIPLENLNLWDVKRYYTKNNLQFENVVTLWDILKPYKKAVSKEEMIENKWQIISKINFGGELFLRDIEEIETYKGSLNLVPDNAIIYSKINVRHGCIYFHEVGQTPFGVSSEYPIFKFDETKVNGKFLHKVLRSSAFKKLLKTKTTGISKARVKQDEFLDIEIPLPSLTEQEAIVNNYYSKIKEAEALEKQASDLEEEIEWYFTEKLGIKAGTGIGLKKGLNFIEYSEILKWSLDTMNKVQFTFDKSNFKTEKLKNLLMSFEGGKTPSKARKDFWNGNIYWTSPKDFKGRMFLQSAEDTITNLAVQESGIKVFPKGVFLSVFRSGILQHSFPTVVTEIETAINQDLKAYTLNEVLIDKLFYLYFVHTFKKYILTLASKKSVTVESINTEDFLEIPIPLPPISIQQEITNRISALKSQTRQLKEKASILKQQAEQEFEQEIFAS
ncbi:MAG: type I restriction enzyme S subunit [Bacteroidetes bacterium]|nr:MAG: type I restriction enzyme S subunit [Bacteroidota bacterium]